jgi:hypothetical protein
MAAFLEAAGLEQRALPPGRLVLFENPHVAPRAFVVYRTLPAPAPAALLASISRPDFDPLVASYVEGDPGFSVAPDAPGRGEAARILIDAEDHVEIDAVLARPGLVVLADTFYPGWSAAVDDTPAAILATNHLFRGVAVPSGRHRIRFTYRPRSLLLGALVSTAGWLVIGSCVARLALVRWRRVRR